MTRILGGSLVILGTGLAGCGKKTYHVPTGAMEPTIPAGSNVVVDRRAFKFSDPERWDVVTFIPPKSTALPNPSAESPWLMRVLGLPGETVEFGGEDILIDGVAPVLPVELSGLKFTGVVVEYAKGIAGGGSVVLGAGDYFVVGDNPKNAYDSRYWGALERGKILGKMVEP